MATHGMEEFLSNTHPNWYHFGCIRTGGILYVWSEICTATSKIQWCIQEYTNPHSPLFMQCHESEFYHNRDMTKIAPTFKKQGARLTMQTVGQCCSPPTTSKSLSNTRLSHLYLTLLSPVIIPCPKKNIVSRCSRGVFSH